jgi:hypothetical protein
MYFRSRSDWRTRLILGAAGGFVGTLAIQALLTASQKWAPNTVPPLRQDPGEFIRSKRGKRRCQNQCVSASHRRLKRVQPACWLLVMD